MKIRIDSALKSAAFAFILAAIWITPDIRYAGSVVLPNYLGILSGVTLVCVAVCCKCLRGEDIKTIAYLVGIVLISQVFTPGLWYFPTEILKGTLQLLFSLATSIVLLRALLTIGTEAIGKFSFHLSLLILAIAFLEAFTPLSSLIDGIGASLYGSDFIYNNPERDYAYYGAQRPIGLTREPSHLGYCLSVLIATSYLCSRAPNRLHVHSLIAVAAILVTRTPVLLSVFIIIAAYQVTHAGSRRSILKPLALILVAPALALIAAAFSFGLFGERLQLIADGADLSTTTRIFAPPLVTLSVLERYPVFGVGVGGKEILSPYIVDVLSFLGFFDRLEVYRNRTVINLVTNYFWLHWMYLGLIGGSLLYIVLFRHFRSNQLSPLLTAVIFCILGQTVGAYVSLKVWVLLAMAAAAGKCILPGEQRIPRSELRKPTALPKW